MLFRNYLFASFFVLSLWSFQHEVLAKSISEVEDNAIVSNYAEKVFFEINLGLDSWTIQSNEPEHPEELYYLLTRKSLQDEIKLPNSATQWPYRDSSPWATIYAHYRVSPPLKLTLKALANQSFGGRVDEFSADYALSPLLGFRTGIVDYKMSWCTDYEKNSPWIHNPNEFCSDSNNKPLVSAAPGIQAYTNILQNNYQIQALIGFYNPKIGGYADMENGRRTFVDTRSTLSNHKYGMSLNLLNTYTSTEYRLSWLHSEISENPIYPRALYFSDGNQHNYSQQNNNMVYMSMHTPIQKKVNLELSAWQFESKQNELGYFNQTDYYDYGFKNSTYMLSFSANLQYLASSTDSYILGYTQTVRRKTFIPIDLFDPANPIYAVEDERFQYTSRAISFAWRHDWSKNMATTVQLIHSQLITALDRSINPHAPITTQGNGLGVRFSYHL